MSYQREMSSGAKFIVSMTAILAVAAVLIIMALSISKGVHENNVKTRLKAAACLRVGGALIDGNCIYTSN
jgi:hypothetical protein